MKNIATKSINNRKTNKDGLRICVMRRIHPDYDFDIWMPKLAPSEKLLKAYVINKTMGWEEFSRNYNSQVINKNAKLIKLICNISTKEKITLLCYEESPTRCHRRLIIEACVRVSQKPKNPFK